MGWTATTNYDSIGPKSTLLITDGKSSIGIQTLKLPARTKLPIKHPDGHTTKAHIGTATRTSAEIRLADRTWWQIAPYDPFRDLPLLAAPGHDVQVWIVRRQIA